MLTALILATLPAAAPAAPQAAELPTTLPPEMAGLNASEQLITLHLMATAHAIHILSQDIPMEQRAADMQQLTERMWKLHEAYAQLDPAELTAAEQQAIGHEQSQQIALKFMALLQQWAARDFDGSPQLKAAVFGFLEAENRHSKKPDEKATKAHTPSPKA